MKTNSLLRKVLHFINIEPELENPDFIHEEIEKGVVFRGTNLWILIFAIVVASIGLNMNSTAVIIGAMLISPLMGPINGIGYSIATYNMELLGRSFRNFSFSVLASLIASTAYFALSPVSTAHSELLARTSPTIYDVLIALFGGLAGIIAISSKQKGNVIPGVAIATALMPPLCTAGYGLATGQFNFFFGAFYLFAINSIFIALASAWISQILKFPIRGTIDPARKKRINNYITLIITIVLLPSIYFGYQLVEQERFTQNANLYISNISLYGNNYLLKNNINPKTRVINLVYAGNQLSEIQKKEIEGKSADFGLKNARIVIEQGLTFTNFDDRNNEVTRLKEQINNLSIALRDREMKLDSMTTTGQKGKLLLSEISKLYPEVKGCTYAETLFYSDSMAVQGKRHIVIFSVEKDLEKKELEKIKAWLIIRLNSDNVDLFIETKRGINR